MLFFRIIVAAAITFPLAAQRDPLFKTEILPVLEKNCVGCHGPERKMAKLDLSSFTGMMEGSSSGVETRRAAMNDGKQQRHDEQGELN